MNAADDERDGASETVPHAGYARRIGPWSAAVVVVGGVVGSGIFVTPSSIAQQTGSGAEQ
ncbi:MAG: hypothetical protein JSS21_05010, partial [Proteobacteria bacterium]|nr:hypothetical protein [Pseudomonadota bacterium]